MYDSSTLVSDPNFDHECYPPLPTHEIFRTLRDQYREQRGFFLTLNFARPYIQWNFWGIISYQLILEPTEIAQISSEKAFGTLKRAKNRKKLSKIAQRAVKSAKIPKYGHSCKLHHILYFKSHKNRLFIDFLAILIII